VSAGAGATGGLVSIISSTVNSLQIFIRPKKDRELLFEEGCLLSKSWVNFGVVGIHARQGGGLTKLIQRFARHVLDNLCR
jgi:hypothetical protein